MTRIIWRPGWSGPKVSSQRFQSSYSVFGPKRLKAFSATQGTAGWWEEKLAQLWETWSSQTSASKHTVSLTYQKYQGGVLAVIITSWRKTFSQLLYSFVCYCALNQGCAIVETGSRYQYQYSMTLGCNTNININNKRSGFATSIPISIVVQLILQYQYWYENHLLQICNINFNNNFKSLTLAIPITSQYHLILQYLGININIWFNNSTIKWFLGVNFTHSNA